MRHLGPHADSINAVAPHQEFEATETTFRGLLEAAPDAIIAVDENGLIVLANRQTERLFGYPRSELIGERVEILIPERFREIHPTHRARYLSDPLPRPMGAGMELAGRRKDGSEFPAEISLSAVSGPTGTVVAAAVRDVTDRKRAEAQFRGLLEAAPDAIVGVRSDGRIALVNAQAERLFGYSRAEMVGQLLEMLIPESMRDIHPSHRSKYFADPRPRPMGAGMQLAARRRDGTEFPAEISLSAIETDEGLLVSAAVRDVSERLEAQAERERFRAAAERERYERQLHQSQRLESLGQLAGGVAHDFNNLLGVISIYSSLVGEEITAAIEGPDGHKWESVRSDVERITQATARATELTHQLLAFGRREVVRPRVLNLNDVVTSMEQLLRRTLGEHVELVTTLSPEIWPVVADPGQIEQVLANLAINARDAMPRGGTLTIDTSNVEVDEAYASTSTDLQTGRHVKLRVSDSGSGMSTEVVERAFEPFFTTKPKGKGTGLGLATVYGIVTQAGGSARIYSEIGIGTTFSALFPASSEILTETEPTPTEMFMRRGGESVLVVEDEEAMREVTRRILARNGYSVLTAATGREAIECALTHLAQSTFF